MSTRQARRRQQRVRQQGGRNPRRAVRTTPWYLEWWAVTGAIVGVIVILVLIVVLNQNSSNAFAPRPPTRFVLQAVENPSASTVAAVGSGGVANPWHVIKGAPLKLSNGKPVLDYEGSEYCPFCGEDRWALINALSRFGTLSGLKFMQSDPVDTDPSTNTFTFRDATYRSRYLNFWHVEENPSTKLGGTGPVLQRDNGAEAAMVALGDPVLPNGGGIPMVNLANRAASTTTFDPTVLHVNTQDPQSSPLTWQQIAANLLNPGNQIQDNIVGAGNWLTAGICKVTKNKPASTCMIPAIQKLEKKVGFTR